MSALFSAVHLAAQTRGTAVDSACHAQPRGAPRSVRSKAPPRCCLTCRRQQQRQGLPAGGWWRPAPAARPWRRWPRRHPLVGCSAGAVGAVEPLVLARRSRACACCKEFQPKPVSLTPAVGVRSPRATGWQSHRCKPLHVRHAASRIGCPQAASNGPTPVADQFHTADLTCSAM